MKFNLTESYIIKCKEEYDEDSSSENWEAVILISDEGKVIGMTNGDNVQLILGDYSKDGNNIKVELYRFFDQPRSSVYLYEFPSDYSKESDIWGTFSCFVEGGIDQIGNCYFGFEKYNGDYNKITQYYSNTINSIIKGKDTLKGTIISKIFKPNINKEQDDFVK